MTYDSTYGPDVSHSEGPRRLYDSAAWELFVFAIRSRLNMTYNDDSAGSRRRDGTQSHNLSVRKPQPHRIGAERRAVTVRKRKRLRRSRVARKH